MNLRQQNASGAPYVRRCLAPFAVAFLILAACGGEAPPTSTPLAAISAETGGMALPGASPAVPDAAAARDATSSVAELPPAAAEPPVLAIGAQIVTTAPAAIYAEPDPTAARFAEYAAGSRLRVIEPDGDYVEYPVVVDGQRWYRVRAEDGLAGWMAEMPEP